MLAAVESSPRPASASAGSAGPWSDPYSDRICAPEVTVSQVREHFAAFGITRLARQTDLDRLGIPCYAAVRPNSRSLAVNQGKGLTDAAAMASAAMEAAEFAVAESPPVTSHLASIRRLRLRSQHHFVARRQLPRAFEPDLDRQLEWLEGFDLDSGEPVLVPREAVVIDATVSPEWPYSRSTNGLASGNDQDEALFHGLCELVERDAASLFAMRNMEARRRAEIRVSSICDPMVDDLVSRIEYADCSIRLFRLDSDIDAASFMAVISGGFPCPDRHFSATAGYGCHPVAARAVLRAVTEAAQGRISNISGSRDDFDPGEYAKSISASQDHLLGGDDEAAAYAAAPAKPTGVTQLLRFLVDDLKRKGIENVIAVPLGGQQFGIAVVKLFVEELEDRSSNANWRPGARAVRAAFGSR